LLFQFRAPETADFSNVFSVSYPLFFELTESYFNWIIQTCLTLYVSSFPVDSFLVWDKSLTFSFVFEGV